MSVAGLAFLCRAADCRRSISVCLHQTVIEYRLEASVNRHARRCEMETARGSASFPISQSTVDFISDDCSHVNYEEILTSIDR